MARGSCGTLSRFHPDCLRPGRFPPDCFPPDCFPPDRFHPGRFHPDCLRLDCLRPGRFRPDCLRPGRFPPVSARTGDRPAPGLPEKKQPEKAVFLGLFRSGRVSHDLLAVIRAAFFADVMGKRQSAAFLASRKGGQGKFPRAGSSLISARLGLSSLRNCHCSTPPWSQKH